MHEVRRMPVFILHIAVVKRQSQIFLIRSWPCISFCSRIFFFHKIFKEPVRVFNCIRLYRNNKREFQIYKSQRERIMNKGKKKKEAMIENIWARHITVLIPRHNLYMVNIARGNENTTNVYVLCVFSVLAEGKILPKIIMGTDFSWLWISLTRRMNLFILTHVQLFSIILKSCEIQHYWFNAKIIFSK